MLPCPAALISNGNGAKFSHFSTNTFLDGYHTDPLTGTVIASLLDKKTRRVGPDSRMVIRRLTDRVIPIWKRTAREVLTDGDWIQHELGAWGMTTSLPLTETGGQWTMTGFAPPNEMDAENPFAEVTLNRTDGKQIFFQWGEDCSGIRVGWQGPFALVRQMAIVTAKGRVETLSYRLTFWDEGLQALRTFLQIDEGASFQELALNLFSKIYFSKQYSPKLLGSISAHAEGDHPIFIKESGRRLSFPQDFPADFHSISIRSERSISDPHQTEEGQEDTILSPVLHLFGHFEAERKGEQTPDGHTYLTVDLYRPPQLRRERFPLCPKVNTLFQGAQRLARINQRELLALDA